MNITIKRSVVAIALLMAFVFGGGAAMAQDLQSNHRALTPVVIFPAFHFTKLEFKVRNQSVAPDCPKSGKFEIVFFNDNPSAQFSQVCQDKLMTLVYDGDLSKPMPERFSEQPGVSVKIQNYGKTESSPYYEDLYVALEGAGYKRNKNIRVAGYDSRLTPDMDGFLERTVELIEKTYRDNRNTPVHLIGHSNGPLYTQYLLTHTSQAWKNKYIHGFTPLAGNWPGQGLFYPVFFIGLNVIDLFPPTTPENALSSALMYQSHPSSYMSAADPAIFGNQEVVVQTPAKAYTPADNVDLYQDANLPVSEELAAYYTGFVKFADPANFPNVDIYAEKASGTPTAVGLQMPDLTVGQVADFNLLLTRDGDGNQEDITNESIQVWQNMACFRFELTNTPELGLDPANPINHFTLPFLPGVVQRLLTNLQRTKSVCP